MLAFYYLIQSKKDGQYLFARPGADREAKFVLLFSERSDALSYLTAHVGAVSDRFLVQSVSSKDLAAILTRWDFRGVGSVEDPLLPKIQFLERNGTK